MLWLSVVMPVRNEAEGIAQVLGPLQALRDQLEIIVVDGGSTDATAALAAPLADKVLASAPGRARQMNAGAAAATGEVLLFLHADTQLPEGFVGMIRAVIPAPPTVSPAPPYVIPPPPRVIPAKAGIQTDVKQTKEPNRKHSAHPHPSMDPRLREDDVGGEREVFSPVSSLSKSTVIPAQAGIQTDAQQTKEPNREHSPHPHPSMDPRLREDDVGGEREVFSPGSSLSKNTAIPTSPTVIPAQAGIQADVKHAKEPNREHSAHPHPAMDPRVREDDVGVGTVIPAQAGIQTDVQQTKESHREHSAHPHPTMDPRVREDDVAGESDASVPGTAGASHRVIPTAPTVIPAPSPAIPAPPFVIPAQAGIQADGQHAQKPNRKHSAHPHPTMDPRVREDDVGVGTVIPAHAGIHFDLGVQSLWGRFDVRLAPSSPTLRLVAWMMNQRSRLTGTCTGDQAIFVRRDLFNRLGGYADIPLMEDIELSKRLKRISPPACIRQPLTTSSRRWQTRGVLRTIVLMWWLRLQYWAGVSPAKLVKKYYPARPSSE